jgi:hypothetical protein
MYLEIAHGDSSCLAYPTKRMKPVPAAWRSSCTRRPHNGNALLFLLGALAWSSAGAVEPGRYEIVARTEMPHLEESLRYATTRERRCLKSDEPAAAMFPILQHPSLEGCTLAGERPRYRLVCATPQVATGSARLDEGPGRIAGVLEIKMGGKNMTFAQRVEAVRQGECETP